MDIIFETDKGRSFTIEVGYFDTIAEIKEKVQKYQHIPVDHQTLYYQGERLCDDWNIQKSLLFHSSRVHLLIADPNPQFKPPPPVRNRIKIILRDETGKRFIIEIDVEDTVKSLKHTLAQIKGLTIDRIALRREFENVEMQDSKRFRDYNLMNGSELIVSQKTPSSMMGIILVLPNGDKLEVNPNGTDKIQEMRKALEKAKESKEVELPEKYYFILNRSVLDEKESFQSNGVREGETIEIFIERVESQTAPSSSSSSNKIEIFLVLPNGMVLLFSGNRTVNVQGIRMHLEGEKMDGKVELPEEYFFTHKKNVMEENESIEGLGVRERDTIKILAGKAPSATSSSQAPPSSSSSSSSKIMRIFFLLPNCRTLGFNATRTTLVQEIRMHLERERNNPKVGLPEEYYFFINNQTVMDEKQSLVGLGVQEGDFVKILAGKAPSATFSSQAPSSSSSSSKTIMIFFELSNGNKLAFDANSTMKVQETKIHLKKAKKDTKLELPEPCFFIHNGSTMKDKQSLEWHGVREGDTIYVMAGYFVPLSMLKG